MYVNVNFPTLPVFSGTQDPADWFEPLPGERMRVRIAGESTEGRLTVLENVVAAGAAAPGHFHHDVDELFIVLEGRIRVTCSNLKFDAGPGSAMFIPRGSAHSFVNETDADARLLSVFSPGGMEAMFREASRTRPDDIAAMARRHRTEVVGPVSTECPGRFD